MAKTWRRICLATFGLLYFALSASAQDSSARIQQLHKQAQNDEQQGHIDAAIEKYQAILELEPGLAPAYNNLGRLYFHQARYTEAIEVLRDALELEPGIASSRALLGISLYAKGDYKSARQELRHAKRLNPSDRNVELYLALTLYELHELGAAAQMLEAIQRKDPQNSQVIYTLGLTYMDLAASTFEKLQNADPDSYLIELLLGRAAEDKQVLGEAIEHYRNAVFKAPSALGAHYALGNALWKNGQIPDALQEFRREMELNPYDYMACAKAALLLLPTNPQEALSLAERALHLNPDLYQALLARGRARLSLGKPKKAVEDFKKLLAADSEDATVHFLLARAYRQLGMTREATAEHAIFERIQKTAHLPTRSNTTKPQ